MIILHHETTLYYFQAFFIDINITFYTIA